MAINSNKMFCTHTLELECNRSRSDGIIEPAHVLLLGLLSADEPGSMAVST